MCFVNGFALHDRPTRWQAARSATLLTTGGVCGRRLNSRFIFHASIFQHIGPFPTRSSMAVLQVLAEMIGSVEFLGLIALVEFVHIGQVFDPAFPVLFGMIGKFFPAETAGIVCRAVGSM